MTLLGITLCIAASTSCQPAETSATGPAAAPATSPSRPSTQPVWTRTIAIDCADLATVDKVKAALKAAGLEVKEYVNWYTLRWPNISFLGGDCTGSVSKDVEFFYDKPFRWWNAVLDFVMDGGGKTYGIRATYRRYPHSNMTVDGGQSYVMTLRCEQMFKTHHPSYILANGRRIWDSKVHSLPKDAYLTVPFWHEETGPIVLDFVVDTAHSPDAQGFAFRLVHVQRLGSPGVKVTLKGAAEEAEGSPADKLQRFAFGLFPAGYDFWARTGPKLDDFKKSWKPNFKPDYPVDDVFLSSQVFARPPQGGFHDFMVTYGGCNVLAGGAKPEVVKQAGYVRGFLVSDVEAAKKVLQADPSHIAFWFRGEHGVLGASSAAARKAMDDARLKVEADKKATGDASRIRHIFEPFPPALTCVHEFERGSDIVVLKNEEDPQYNIMMAMARGAARSAQKQFGFYWEQTHYPYPSMDFKLHACLLYYFSGGSYIGAENDNAPAFFDGIAAEWVVPFIKAQRLAMVHPSRGESIVPVGVLWTDGDAWWIPYNPLGHMDTFQRYIEYDHATGTLKCEPSFVRPLHYVPKDKTAWNFVNAGHLPHFDGRENELRGYDLLDVFFPQYGDAFTARISRLLTGTPYGPVDFVYGNLASADRLKSYGMIAILGHANIDPALEAKLTAAAEAGTPVLAGAQHFRAVNGRTWHKPFGLTIRPGIAKEVDGKVTGNESFYKDADVKFAGKINGFAGEGWQTVASVGDQPLVIRKAAGKGAIYVYLGEWIGQGGDALRPILHAMGRQSRPLEMTPADDQMEYVAYRKGAGAWVAMFNHGGIAVGCDRIIKERATPPEPLVSKVKGPWKGSVSFRLERLGLDPKKAVALYEVEGIDGDAFEGVLSGRRSFVVREIPSTVRDGVLTADVRIAHRAQYVVAPKGQGEAVFFGRDGAAKP